MLFSFHSFIRMHSCDCDIHDILGQHLANTFGVKNQRKWGQYLGRQCWPTSWRDVGPVCAHLMVLNVYLGTIVH